MAALGVISDRSPLLRLDARAGTGAITPGKFHRPMCGHNPQAAWEGLGERVTMRIDTRPRHRNAPRPAWKVEAAYLQWLRGRSCMLSGNDCAGKIEAAHTPDPASKGMGTKAADRNAIPLCQHHHSLHTVKGWSAIGLTREAATVAAASYWKAWKGDKGELANGS